MLSRRYAEAALLVIGALLLYGCTAPSPRKPAGPAVPAKTETVSEPRRESSEVLERRAEAQAHYAAAILHDLNEEPEKAAEELYKALLLESGDESLVLDATRRLIQLKQYDKAAEVLAKAAAQPGASGEIDTRLGLVYTLMGKNEEARRASLRAIEKTPDSIGAYQNLSRLHLQAGQYAEGIKLLDKAAQVPKTSPTFLVDLAEMYTLFLRASATNNPKALKEKTLQILKRAESQNSANPMVIQKLADGFLMLNESERAINLYDNLFKRFPNLPGLQEKLAELYLRRKDFTNAVGHLQGLIRNNPTLPQAHYLLGSIALEQRKPAEAIDHFRDTLLLNPSFEPAYYDLALAQINMKQPEQALETLEKAQTKFPNTFTGEFFTGLAYASTKKFSNAIPHFIAAEVIARATDTNRLTHYFYFQLGAAYERTGQHEDAVKQLRKALSISPDFTEGLNYLAYMWAERGTNLVEAREMLNKALKEEPENGAYLDSMAWVLYKMKKHQQALDYQLKAIKLTPEADATLYDHLGDIYAALGMADKAREAWRKAMELEPSPEIQKKIEAPIPESKRRGTDSK